MVHPELRPLGIGEILDRAIQLFVRRFAVFALILAVVAIPLAILQFAAQPDIAALSAAITRALNVPPGQQPNPREIVAVLSKNRLGVWAPLLTMVSLLFSTLSSAACIIAIAQAAAGRLPSVRAVYRDALGRWLPLLVAGVLLTAVLFAVMIALTIAATLVAVGVGALGAASRPAALIVGIPVAIVIVAVVLAVLALWYLSLQLTYVAIALEEPNPFRGIAHGLRRTLSRTLLLRSILVAVVCFLVSIAGIFISIALGGTLAALTHLSALYTIVVVIGGLALQVLLLTFLVLYSTDLRIRREGYDLLVAAGGESALPHA